MLIMRVAIALAIMASASAVAAGELLRMVDIVDGRDGVMWSAPRLGGTASLARSTAIRSLVENAHDRTVLLGGGSARGAGSRSLLAEDLDPVDPQPIRFKTSFQISSLDAQEQQYVVDMVTNATDRLSSTVSIKRPVVGPLFLERRCVRGWVWQQSGIEECGEYADDLECFQAKHRQQYFGEKVVCSGVAPNDCVTTPGGTGAEDADFVLYVTAQQTEGCGGIGGGEDNIAQGGFCAVDEASGRPLAGAINFCPGAIDVGADRPGADVATHEIVHALVFSQELFSLFIDDDGDALGYENVVESDGTGSTYISTPKVREMARAQAGCEVVPGALLENDGSTGTEGVHWESRHYRGEMMVGTTPSADVDAALSNVTLALFEDSGWYEPHYCKADALLWQYRAGCDAYFADCSDRPLPESLATTFCSEEGTTGCVYDFTSVGVCSPMALNDGCDTIEAYNNLQCTSDGFGDGEEAHDEDDANSPLFWGQTYGDDSRCLPMIAGETSKRIVRDGLTITTYSRENIGGGCFTVECEYGDGDGDPSLYVSVFGKRMRCREGEMVSLSGIRGFMAGGAKIGPCPPASSVCRTFSEGLELLLGEENGASGNNPSGDGQREGSGGGGGGTDDGDAGDGDGDGDDDDNGNFLTACFPSGATVALETGETVEMAALSMGDRVAVPSRKQGAGGVAYEEVLSFTHFDIGGKSRSVYVTVVVDGDAEGDQMSLVLSRDHLIPVIRVTDAAGAGADVDLDAADLVRADSVREGDIVFRRRQADVGTFGTDSVAPDRRKDVVESAIVRRAFPSKATGLVHPHTASGMILVNGFVVSCYTSVAPRGVVENVLRPAHLLHGIARRLMEALWGSGAAGVTSK